MIHNLVEMEVLVEVEVVKVDPQVEQYQEAVVTLRAQLLLKVIMVEQDIQIVEILVKDQLVVAVELLAQAVTLLIIQAELEARAQLLQLQVLRLQELVEAEVAPHKLMDLQVQEEAEPEEFLQVQEPQELLILVAVAVEVVTGLVVELHQIKQEVVVVKELLS